MNDEGSKGGFFFSRCDGVTVRKNRAVFPVRHCIPGVEIRNTRHVQVAANAFPNADPLVLDTSHT